MESVEPQNEDQQSLVRTRLRKLLDFSGDIERNESDAAFAAGGGKIIYVFDENVFEYFIGATSQERTDLSKKDIEDDFEEQWIFHDTRKYPAIFHLKEWLDPGENRKDEWTKLNRQNAIITSEFLFSGNLP